MMTDLAIWVVLISLPALVIVLGVSYRRGKRTKRITQPVVSTQVTAEALTGEHENIYLRVEPYNHYEDGEYR